MILFIFISIVVVFILVGLIVAIIADKSLVEFLLLIAIIVCVGGIVGKRAVEAINIYKELVALKQQIVALEHNVDRIRTAIYQENNNSAFDSKNFKQSTNLSNYLRKVAELKGEYNYKLRKAYFHRHYWLYYWFWDGFLIPSAIDTMQYY